MTATHGRGARVRQSLALLGSRTFGVYWFASLLSNIGFWANEVAQPWLLLGLGASSFLVGLDSFVGDAPGWLLTLAGGFLADRYDRRKIITLFQTIQMLCPIALVVLIVTDTVQPWMIIVTSLVVGITDALSMPSFQTIVPSIVRRDQIGAGLALSSTQFNLSRVLGPGMAGLLMAGAGAVWCFVANAASYIPFILVALWILPRGRVHAAPGEATHDDVHEAPSAGLRTIVGAPHVRWALCVVAALCFLCSPLLTFCPILVRDAFGGSGAAFSIAVSAFGVGGLLGGIILLGVDTDRDQRRLTVALAVACGGAVVGAGLARAFWLLPVVLVIAGATLSMTNTLINTLLQVTSSPSRRGQTISLVMFAMRGGMALGSLATGAMVGIVGVRTALVVNGVLAMAAQLTLGALWLRSRLPEDIGALHERNGVPLADPMTASPHC